MKPTTYYVQTPQIDALAERFGSQLQEMQPEDKLALLVTLSYYLYLVKAIGEFEEDTEEDYSLQDAFDIGIGSDRDVTSYDFPNEIMPMLEGISVETAQGLIVAISNQLAYGDR